MEIKTDKETLKVRQSHCNNCKHKEYVVPILNLVAQCGECRCILKAKQNFKFSVCPVGKW